MPRVVWGDTRKALPPHYHRLPGFRPGRSDQRRLSLPFPGHLPRQHGGALARGAAGGPLLLR